ncbi:hypothetical protein NDU88_006614 [Pleurodeles waltl]|uniref:Uncharacterized protein n=1 Tax=Pleurodeles waltl TaxID=8319 RepID=A0AAV7PJB6_PLEWA|nr:hypothetical protein NDU88_006614 [Pleurodeles waltl]
MQGPPDGGRPRTDCTGQDSSHVHKFAWGIDEPGHLFYNSISGTAWDAQRRIQTYYEEQPLRILLLQRGSCREAVTAGLLHRASEDHREVQLLRNLPLQGGSCREAVTARAAPPHASWDKRQRMTLL